jgi:O-antigen/teichoic acid export membrane protein
LVALAVCGILFAFAHPVVQLLYGAAFLPVVPVLQTILVGVFALSLGSPMSSYFTLKLGRPEVAMWLAGGSAAICIAISLSLVPSLGMMGAAIGSTVAYVCGQIAAIWYFSRSARIDVREILIPTSADASVYWGFLGRLLADGRALLGPTTHKA